MAAASGQRRTPHETAIGTANFTVSPFIDEGFDMKKLAAVLVLASGMALAPMAFTPVAQADVCAAAGGRHVSVGGCTNVAGDAAAVAIVSQDNPYVPGEVPCYTVQGTPYYTPPGQPC